MMRNIPENPTDTSQKNAFERFHDKVQAISPAKAALVLVFVMGLGLSALIRYAEDYQIRIERPRKTDEPKLISPSEDDFHVLQTRPSLHAVDQGEVSFQRSRIRDDNNDIRDSSSLKGILKVKGVEVENIVIRRNESMDPRDCPDNAAKIDISTGGNILLNDPAGVQRMQRKNLIDLIRKKAEKGLTEDEEHRLEFLQKALGKK